MTVRTPRLAAGALALVAAGSLPASAERGADGDLAILFWQAPSVLNPYVGSGTKETEVASVVLEPLARYDDAGEMVPWLVDSVPTVENGGVSEDLTSITWVLSEGLVWSDGTPLTSADVKFTWEYCTDPEGGCARVPKFANVASMDTPDERTVVINFDGPKPFPYGPFVGAFAPVLQKAQFEDCTGVRMPTCTEANFAPIGTGPFVVTDFRPNDVAVFAANENYRDAAKPAFSTLTVKGGGDAVSAARAVLQTGEFDYAWNLQVSPDVLDPMAEGGTGEIVVAFGNSVEQLFVNLTDPSPELGEARSTVGTQNPRLSAPQVREALSLAIDRALLVELGYGDAGRPTCDILQEPAIFRSGANDACLEQDLEAASALLDAAGWIDADGDGIRDKDGVPLSLDYITTMNAVRQDVQALVKQWWSQIGVETTLRSIDGSVFFGEAGGPDSVWRFQADVEMWMNNFDGTDPEAYMASYACSEIPTPENQWQGNNMPRFCDDAYDALVADLAGTGSLSERADIAKAMNDMLMQSHVIIPLVNRGRVSGKARDLEGVRINAWDSELWNVADWSRAD